MTDFDICLNLLREFYAVHLWHQDVGNNKVHVLALQTVECVFSVRSLQDTIVSAQKPVHHVQKFLVILNKKDARRIFVELWL